MRVNKNKYPVLGFLKSTNGALIPNEWLSFGDGLLAGFTEKAFKKHEVFCFSKSFIDSYLKALSKMIDDRVFGDASNLKGTILNFRIIPFDGELSICYSTGESENNEYPNMEYYLFIGEKMIAFRIDGGIVVDPRLASLFNNMFKEVIKKDLSGERLYNEIGRYITTALVSYLNFLRYAEIETKILPPKTKSIKLNCMYNNLSDLKISFINSTWLTNLVKSDAFKVSGHFRLQPCHDKDGLPTKKLIWISEYMKEGYTAPARKLK